MKIAIIYATHHGTTETVAKIIQDQLHPLSIELINLSEIKNPDPANYEMVILGSSIHAGKNQHAMQIYCKKHLTELLQKQIGLFLCCMNFTEKQQSMQNAYPALLRHRAFGIEFMGGEYKREKMNFIEKILLKKIAGVTESLSNIDKTAIEKFIQEINKNIKTKE